MYKVAAQLKISTSEINAIGSVFTLGCGSDAISRSRETNEDSRTCNIVSGTTMQRSVSPKPDNFTFHPNLECVYPTA